MNGNFVSKTERFFLADLLTPLGHSALRSLLSSVCNEAPSETVM